MRLYIENWSSGKLVSLPTVRELIARYTFGGTPDEPFIAGADEWGSYPTLVQLLPKVVVPEPIYILKLRPETNDDVAPFQDWLANNGYVVDIERRQDPSRIGLHSDIYGIDLEEFITGRSQVPLTPENIAGYKSPGMIRDELREAYKMRKGIEG